MKATHILDLVSRIRRNEVMSMRLTTAVLYHPLPWTYLRLYRWTLVFLRVGELGFIIARYLLIRGPLEIIRTRLGRPVMSTAGVDTEDVLVEGTPLPGVGMAAEQGVTGGLGLIRRLIEELGPTFIKLGQVLSMRAEIPPSLRQELQKLQERVPPMPYKEVRKNVCRELGVPLEEVFTDFREKPIAAGSLGQVHRAVLRKEGEEVAVKVQRSRLQGIVEIDLMIIETSVTILPRLLPDLNKKTKAKGIITGFADQLRSEIDFYLEGKNQERVAALIERRSQSLRKFFKIAKVHWDYTTSKLLIMELLKGLLRLDTEEAIQRLKSYGTDDPMYSQYPYPWAVMACDIMHSMIVLDGFWHCDPHSGNMYLLPDGSCALVDFGMCATLTEEERGRVLDFLRYGFFEGDIRKLVQLFINLHMDGGGSPDEINTSLLAERMREFMDRRLVGEAILKPKGVSSLSTELLTRLMDMGVRIPSYFWGPAKTLTYMEDIGVRIIPDYDCMPMFVIPLKKGLKERILAELETKNALNIRPTLKQLLEPLHDPAVGGMIRDFGGFRREQE